MCGLCEKSLGFGGVMCVFVVVLVGVFMVVFGAMPVSAHSGVVDRNGCHTRTDTGERHCHGGSVGAQSSSSSPLSDVRQSGVLGYSQAQATALFCEPWLQGLLSTQHGVRHIVGSIGQAALQRDYDWVPSVSIDGLPQFTLALKKTGLEIVRIDTKTVGNTGKFSWVLVVKNDSPNDKVFTVVLQWQDNSGFVLGSDTERNLLISANEEKQFSGHQYVGSSSVARTITSITAKLTYTDLNNTTQRTVPITRFTR